MKYDNLRMPTHKNPIHSIDAKRGEFLYSKRHINRFLLLEKHQLLLESEATMLHDLTRNFKD